MLAFTTKAIRPAVIKKFFELLKMQKTKQIFTDKIFQLWGYKKFSIYAKMCFYFLMQVKMIIFIIRSRICSNSIKT